MSLYTVTIEDRTYQVDITSSRCTVNGEEMDTRVLPLNDNGLHLLRNGRGAYEVFLSSPEADTYQLQLFGGRRIITRISNRTKKNVQSGECADQAAGLCAPMHGLVVDVPVREGETVAKNQTLVVLESMKMQMQLRSPRDGKVAKVTVRAGDQVEKGALLVQFE